MFCDNCYYLIDDDCLFDVMDHFPEYVPVCLFDEDDFDEDSIKPLIFNVEDIL